MSTVYLSELTGSRLVGSATTQTLSDLSVNPDPAIGLEADDAEEAIDELAADIKAITTPPVDIQSAIDNLDNGINS